MLPNINMYTCENILRLRVTMHIVKLHASLLRLVPMGTVTIKPEVVVNPEIAINRKWQFTERLLKRGSERLQRHLTGSLTHMCIGSS